MPWRLDYPQEVKDRLTEYFLAGVVNTGGLDAVEADLVKWADRYPRSLVARDVDFAVLLAVYGAGDCMGGMACTWQFGQQIGQQKRPRRRDWE